MQVLHWRGVGEAYYRETSSLLANACYVPQHSPPSDAGMRKMWMRNRMLTRSRRSLSRNRYPYIPTLIARSRGRFLFLVHVVLFRPPFSGFVSGGPSDSQAIDFGRTPQCLLPLHFSYIIGSAINGEFRTPNKKRSLFGPRQKKIHLARRWVAFTDMARWITRQKYPSFPPF